MFHGRAKELKELNERFIGKRKEFGVMYGRRRAGKSALIGEFSLGKDAIIFQAKKDSSYGNLRSFSYVINRKLSLPSSFVFSSYEEAFEAINGYLEEHRLLLVIDEYPYILEQMPSFSSLLQEFFDKANDNLFLIISGSDVSFLKNEILDHNSPLYKRRTFEMKIGRLDYSEALEFLEGMDNEEKSKYLSLMSTYPYYLASIDPDLSFENNVKKLLFSPFGTFFSLPDQILSSSTRVQDIYNAILLAISHRHQTTSDISSYIKEDEPKVSKYLSVLISSEIVRKCETFKGSKKTSYYEMDDPLLGFYYRFIFHNDERIMMNGEVIYEELKEKIHLYLSHGFENIARLYLDQKNRNGELLTVYPPLKPFKADKTSLGRSIEIDGLSSSGNKLLIIECKYRNTRFDEKMLLHLYESVSIFGDEDVKEYYIFSKSGFTDEVLARKEKNLHLIDFDELFAL